MQLVNQENVFEERRETVLAIIVDFSCILAVFILIISPLVVPWARARYEAVQVARLVDKHPLGFCTHLRLSCIRLGCGCRLCCSNKQLSQYEEEAEPYMERAFDIVKDHEGSCKMPPPTEIRR